MQSSQTGGKRILYVEEACGLGGSNFSVSNLISGMSAKGHVCVLVLHFRNPEFERNMLPGIKVYHMREYCGHFLRNYLTGWRGLPKVTKAFKAILWGAVFAAEGIRRMALTYWIIRANRIDIVHANNTLMMNRYAILAAKTAGVPCVCHVREFETLSPYYKMLLKAATRIITVSKGVKDAYVQQRVVQETGTGDKFTIIYNGLTDDKLLFDYDGHRELRDEYKIGADTRAIGMVGMVTEWKGFHVFLDAAKLILEKDPDVVFFVVGETVTKDDDNYGDFLRSKAVELGISDKVIFTGLRIDTRNVYASLDVVIHASLAPEPFGRVIIEAMAASKPVVAVNSGGPAEIIRHGETGLLYTCGDAADLSRQVLRLLADQNLCVDIGKNARKHVEENFNINITIHETEKVYDAVASL